MRVRVPLRPLQIKTREQKRSLAYIVGVTLGDGNLSNPNGRAVRIRVSCDVRYPKIQEEIIYTLHILLPKNAILKMKRPRHCVDIVVYSNELGKWIPWKVGEGPKEKQNARVPSWILKDKELMKHCLRGLLQTDGSIYYDRGYLMVNFTNNILDLCRDVRMMMQTLGFTPTFHQAMNKSGTKKYTVRLARNSQSLIDLIRLHKT